MINTVSLTGRIAQEIKIHDTENARIGSFILAVQRKRANKDGEREADFIRIVVFNKIAENIEKYTKKGSLIGIEGNLQTSNYENKEGQKVYVTEVLANSVTFLESKSNNSNIDYSSAVEITDDDCPF